MGFSVVCRSLHPYYTVLLSGTSRRLLDARKATGLMSLILSDAFMLIDVAMRHQGFSLSVHLSLFLSLSCTCTHTRTRMR